jgi:hypothetical protein
MASIQTISVLKGSEPKTTVEGGWQRTCWIELSLRLLIAVLIPELRYLTSDEVRYMRLNKHVRRIKHVHDEPLRSRHRGIQIDDELCHRHITAGTKNNKMVEYQEQLQRGPRRNQTIIQLYQQTYQEINKPFIALTIFCEVWTTENPQEQC